MTLGASNAAGYDGRLIDGGTGQPAADVWVIGHWETGGGIAHGSGGCVIAITRTDDKGAFSLVREGFVNRLFGGSPRPNIDFYKDGLRQRFPQPEKDDQPFIVTADERALVERLDELLQIIRRTDCGEAYSLRHRDELLPLYRLINAEARAKATSARERNAVISTQFFIDQIEWGYHEATRRAREARDAVQ